MNLNVQGKITKVNRNSGSTKPTLEFTYDAMGQRLSKKVTESSGNVKTFYYIRDAQGNEMSRYVHYTDGLGDEYFVSEEHSIYGSSRLGLQTRRDTLYKNTTITPNYDYVFRDLGTKQYELSNHLGNVLATITDQNKPVSGGGITIDNYEPVVVSISDYYPFGSLIQNRSWSDASRVYRYGFNGKEKDFETSSDNYDFGARIYDGRLGRWLSLDPLMKIYPSSSPYSGNGNSPIWLIDIDGCRILIQSIAQIGNINYSSCYEYRDGKLYSQNPETGIFDIEYAPIEGEYAYTALNALNTICGTATGLKLINDIQTSETIITIKNLDDKHNSDIYRYSDLNPETHDDNIIYTDFSDEIYPVQKDFVKEKYQVTPGWIVLAHELAHAYDDIFNLGFSKIIWETYWDPKSNMEQKINKGEIFACHIENRIRSEVGMRLRTHYGTQYKNGNVVGDPTTELINYNGESLFFNKIISLNIRKSECEIDLQNETGAFDEGTTKETYKLERYRYNDNNSGDIEKDFTTKK